ncbi:MAG: hypothetical protein HY043_16915 [Verrucomicrobia bacterium]|nr:hypothetical protein [Verrucomicrobiota bacterium]
MKFKLFGSFWWRRFLSNFAFTLFPFCSLMKYVCSTSIAAPFINLDFQAANTNRSQIEERFILQPGIPVGLYLFWKWSGGGFTSWMDGNSRRSRNEC